MLLLGDPISAETAQRWGLVSEVLDDAAVEPRALALAAQLVALPAVALRLVKESVLMAMETPLAAGLAFERAAFQTTFATADKHEGMRARLDKRAAKFEGR